MPEIHRLGDPNEEDDIIIGPAQSTVYANNLLVSVDGSLIDNDDVTANGASNVFAEYIPVNFRTNPDLQTEIPRAQGSPNVFVQDNAVKE